MNVLPLLLDIYHGSLLLNNSSVHVLKELPELDHLFLNLLDSRVSSLYSAQCRL